jgi:DNA polymerase-3 subunit delta'
MGFEGLLGNDRLKDNLRHSLRQGRSGHFYLISGPKGSGKHTLANLLAAAMMCREQERPCGRCGPCRKVLGGLHPDFITVDDPEKKTVPVELIREARSDMYIQPNEGARKIYLFPRAQDMGVPGQNALLKILEEPPAYGVFLLLTDNPQKLLPTVRSRCVELALSPLPEPLLRRELGQRFPGESADTLSAVIRQSGGYLGQALTLLEGEEIPEQTENFLRAYMARDPYRQLLVLGSMEKWKRDRLLEVLQQWESIFAQALVCRSGGEAISPLARELSGCRSSQELLQGLQKLKKCIEYAQGNVSPGAICGYLLWTLT